MYEIIHFTIEDDDFAFPESLKEFFISNPDVERHDSHATTHRVLYGICNYEAL